MIPLENDLQLEQLPIPARVLTLNVREKIAAFNPHRHAYFEIFFFEKGAGQHVIDFTEHLIEDYSIHLVAAGQVHILQRELNSYGKALLFSGSSIEDINVLGQLFSAKSPFSIAADEFRQLLTLVEIVDKTDKKQEQLLSALLKPLLLKLRNLSPFQLIAPENNQDASGQFKLLIEKHYRSMHLVKDYAALLNVSANHLNALCKKHFLQSASEIIQQRVLLEAKRLIIHSGQTAKEIAYQLGFKDPSHFAKFFKKHSQLSPGNFRESVFKRYKKE